MKKTYSYTFFYIPPLAQTSSLCVFRMTRTRCPRQRGADINDTLEDLDNKIMEVNPEKVTDLSLNTGLGGIIHYILSRMYTIKKEQLDNPLDNKFIQALYKRVKAIIESKNTKHDSIDVYINFIKYYEHEMPIMPPTIYDIANLICPPKCNIEKYPLGIYGSAGIGLKLILEKGQIKRFIYS